jgi:hypothetical protein
MKKALNERFFCGNRDQLAGKARLRTRFAGLITW